jgi:predicted acyltransferase
MENTSEQRLLSLDVFRGITIAAMVVVNNPGTWAAVYPQLKHAEWHGWTITDFVFPFFVFIVGVAIPLALGKRVAEGATDRELYLKILYRGFVIFGLGLFQMGFPFFDISKTTLPLAVKVLAVIGLILTVGFFVADRFKASVISISAVTLLLAGAYFADQGFPYERMERIRIMGVLQRLAICYFFAAIIFIKTGWRLQVVVTAFLLFLYWGLMYFAGGGDLSPEGNFSGYIDRLVLGEEHIWRSSRVYDPEGVLSTLPAIATCIIGVLCGTYIRESKGVLESKISTLFFFGCVLTAIGWSWDFWFPINKPIWTSSYAVFTGGLAMVFLAACMWLIDAKSVRRWTYPFRVFGVNALALYFASSIVARIMFAVKFEIEEGQIIHSQRWIFDSFFKPYAEPMNASLIFALVYLGVWYVLMWALYKKKIFIKV